jgi:hypothetical protein
MHVYAMHVSQFACALHRRRSAHIATVTADCSGHIAAVTSPAYIKSALLSATAMCTQCQDRLASCGSLSDVDGTLLCVECLPGVGGRATWACGTGVTAHVVHALLAVQEASRQKGGGIW